MGPTGPVGLFCVGVTHAHTHIYTHALIFSVACTRRSHRTRGRCWCDATRHTHTHTETHTHTQPHTHTQKSTNMRVHHRTWLSPCASACASTIGCVRNDQPRLPSRSHPLRQRNSSTPRALVCACFGARVLTAACKHQRGSSCKRWVTGWRGN